MKYIHYVVIFTVSFLFVFNNAKAELLSKSESEKLLESARERDTVLRQKKLEEFLVDKNELVKFVVLPSLSLTSLQNRDYSAAESYAKEMLKLADLFKENWNCGNAIHDGNMTLGIISLRDNNIGMAKEYLLKAGLAPESPQIHVYGPYMILADALLDAGEEDAVISYLELIKSSWIDNDGRIDSWIASIKGGVKPYFGMNLPFKFIKN